MKGIYLTAPHGEWIVTGKKKAIIKAKLLPDEYVGVEIYLCSGKLVYGIITLSRPQKISGTEFDALREIHRISTEERKKWWPEEKEFYMYSFELHEIFIPPKSFAYKPGTQSMLEEVQIEKEETSTADRLGQMNSPTFAYLSVYGKMPEQWISGRTDYAEKPYRIPGRDITVTIDEHLKPEWFDALNSIDELEIRASCEGHDAERVAYIVFRLRQENDVQAEEVSRRLNEIEGIYSKCDIGTEGRPRIVAAGKTWYGQEDWSSWWEELPGRLETVINEIVLEKGVRQAFGSPGGKKILAAKICAYIPEHKVYCEPFMGGGAVFFRKKPSELEVINDKDSEIAFAYRFIKGISKEDLAWLKKRSWKITRDHFERVKKMEPRDNRERFYKFYYCTKASYGRTGNTVNTGAIDAVLGPLDYLEKTKERLRSVSIYNKDYREILKAHDSKEAFFYLDPPYPGKGNFEDLQIDPSQLKEVCRKLKAKFILSLPTSLSKEFSGFHQLRVKTSEQFDVGGTWQKFRIELLVSNFPLKTEFKYIEKEIYIEEVSFEKGIRPAFGSPGGKRMLAAKISTYIPKHNIYCEPFVGGGAVLFKKDSSALEVINDKDPEIAFAYRFMKNVTDEQIKQLKRYNWKPDEGIFKRLLEKEPKDDVERFRTHIYLQQWSVGGLKERFSGGGEWNYSDYPKTISQYEKYKERLQNIKVFNQDYSKIIDDFDSKDTFFYFDPPYKSHWMGEDFKFDEEEFKECLKKLKGKFILSYSVEGKELFKDFKSKEVKTEKHIIGKPKTVRTELLISNFSLEPLYEYISKTLAEEEDPDVLEKGVRQAFGSPAGKSNLAERIIRLIPEHRVYVEPFIGGGAILFRKLPSEIEVINDKDSEIAFCFKYIQNLTDERIGKLKKFNWISSRSKWQTLLNAKEPANDEERIYNFIYSLKGSFSLSRRSYRPAAEGQSLIPNFDAWLGVKERIKDVKIYAQDYKPIIEKFDSKDTFFYLDPPYPSEWTGPVQDGKQFDLEALSGVLKKIKGKFILSIDKSAKNRKLFNGFDFRTISRKTFFNRPDQRDDPKHVEVDVEYLISNFHLKTENKYIEKDFVEEVIVKQGNPYMLIPDEDETYKYVVQTHFREKTAHRDFRIESECKNYLIGWTLADMAAGTIKEPVTTMVLARKYDANNECWKIDFNRGKFKLRRTRAGNLVPAEIRAFEKAKEPHEWLNVSGITKPWPSPGSTKEYPGVFTIVDKGVCEYGAQKPDFHEYFLHGKLKGKLCIRKITREQFKKEYGIDEIIERILPPGKLEEAVETEPSFWVAIQPLDQKPYVISERAVQKEWMPPVGISALPVKVRKTIPSEYRYWEKESGADANKVRNDLVDAISSGEMVM